MNTITKIDTKNGVFTQGEIFLLSGNGSQEKEDFGFSVLGEDQFHILTGGAMVIGQKGSNPTQDYYLTLDQAEIWNDNIAQDPLMDRAIELAVDGIEILGYGRPEGYEIKEGYEYDYINEYYENLNAWTTQGTPLPESDRIYFQRPIKTSSCRHLKNYERTITEYSDPDLSALTHNQLKNYHRDKWLELLTGSIPKDQHGEKNGTITSVAKALYGNPASK